MKGNDKREWWPADAFKIAYPMTYETIFARGLAAGIEAYGKEGEYRWHDIRKNPQDLPEEGRMILYVFRHELCIGHTYKIREYKNGDLSNATTLTYIAWRYLDVYEE